MQDDDEINLVEEMVQNDDDEEFSSAMRAQDRSSDNLSDALIVDERVAQGGSNSGAASRKGKERAGKTLVSTSMLPVIVAIVNSSLSRSMRIRATRVAKRMKTISMPPSGK